MQGPAPATSARVAKPHPGPRYGQMRSGDTPGAAAGAVPPRLSCQAVPAVPPPCGLVCAYRSCGSTVPRATVCVYRRAGRDGRRRVAQHEQRCLDHHAARDRRQRVSARERESGQRERERACPPCRQRPLRQQPASSRTCVHARALRISGGRVPTSAGRTRGPGRPPRPPHPYPARARRSPPRGAAPSAPQRPARR